MKVSPLSTFNVQTPHFERTGKIEPKNGVYKTSQDKSSRNKKVAVAAVAVAALAVIAFFNRKKIGDFINKIKRTKGPVVLKEVGKRITRGKEMINVSQNNYGIGQVELDLRLGDEKPVRQFFGAFRKACDRMAPNANGCNGIKHIKDNLYEVKITGGKIRLFGKLGEDGILKVNGYAVNGLHKGQSQTIKWLTPVVA